MQSDIKPYFRSANYYETDKMGIVHHSNYIRWFEEARIDYMRKAGLVYTDIENEGILMPVIDVSCRYKVPVNFDEEVKIITKLIYFNGIRMKYSYEIYKTKDSTLSAVGESEHCFIDEQTRKPINLKKMKSRFMTRGIQLLADIHNGK